MGAIAAATILAAAGTLAPATDGASPAPNPFTSAVMHFDPDTGTVTPGGGTPIPGFVPGSVFYYICWTPGDSETNTVVTGNLNIAADGTLNGSCTANRDSKAGANGGGGANVAKAATLTGSYDAAAGTVTFHLEGKGVYQTHSDPNCQTCPEFIYGVEHDLVVDGPVEGGKVEGDQATGRAKFTYTCKPVTENAACLNSFSGTVGFTMQFLTAAASAGAGGAGTTAEPGAGGTTPGGDDEPDLPTVILILILFALLLLTLEFLRRGGPRRGMDKLHDAGTALAVVALPALDDSREVDTLIDAAGGAIDVADRDRAAADRARKAAFDHEDPPDHDDPPDQAPGGDVPREP